MVPLNARTEGVVLTAEELFVFALGRGLPVPAGVTGMDSLRLAPDQLRQRLEQAARVLVARGVRLGLAADSSVGESELECWLRTICQPVRNFVIGTGRPTSLHLRQFAIGDGLVVGHAWNPLDLHLVYKVEPAALEFEVLKATGLPAEGDGLHGRTISMPGTRVRDAIAGDAEGLEALVGEALSCAGAPGEWASDLAACILGKGILGLALFRSAVGDESVVFELSWYNAGDTGLWLRPDETRDTGQFVITRVDPIEIFDRVKAGYALVRGAARG